VQVGAAAAGAGAHLIIDNEKQPPGKSLAAMFWHRQGVD